MGKISDEKATQVVSSAAEKRAIYEYKAPSEGVLGEFDTSIAPGKDIDLSSYWKNRAYTMNDMANDWGTDLKIAWENMAVIPDVIQGDHEEIMEYNAEMARLNSMKSGKYKYEMEGVQRRIQEREAKFLNDFPNATSKDRLAFQMEEIPKLLAEYGLNPILASSLIVQNMPDILIGLATGGTAGALSAGARRATLNKIRRNITEDITKSSLERFGRMAAAQNNKYNVNSAKAALLGETAFSALQEGGSVGAEVYSNVYDHLSQDPNLTEEQRREQATEASRLAGAGVGAATAGIGYGLGKLMPSSNIANQFLDGADEVTKRAMDVEHAKKLLMAGAEEGTGKKPKSLAQQAAERAALQSTQEATGEVAAKVATEGLGEVAEEGAETTLGAAAKDIAGDVTGEGAEQVAKEATEEVAETAAKEVAEEIIDETTGETVESATEKALAIVTSKVSAETSEEAFTETVQQAMKEVLGEVEVSPEHATKIFENTQNRAREALAKEAATDTAVDTVADTAADTAGDVAAGAATTAAKTAAYGATETPTYNALSELLKKYGERGKQVGKAAVGEVVEENLQGVTGNAIGNVTEAAYGDPTKEWHEGLGETVATGTVGAAGLSGGLSAAKNVPAALLKDPITVAAEKRANTLLRELEAEQRGEELPKGKNRRGLLKSFFMRTPKLSEEDQEELVQQGSVEKPVSPVMPTRTEGVGNLGASAKKNTLDVEKYQAGTHEEKESYRQKASQKLKTLLTKYAEGFQSGKIEQSAENYLAVVHSLREAYEELDNTINSMPEGFENEEMTQLLNGAANFSEMLLKKTGHVPDTSELEADPSKIKTSEDAQNVAYSMFKDPEKLTDSLFSILNKSPLLSKSERELLTLLKNSLPASRGMPIEGKSSYDVYNDVIKGKGKFTGLRTHLQNMEAALFSGDKNGVMRTLFELTTWANTHNEKASTGTITRRNGKVEKLHPTVHNTVKKEAELINKMLETLTQRAAKRFPSIQKDVASFFEETDATAAQKGTSRGPTKGFRENVPVRTSAKRRNTILDYFVSKVYENDALLEKDSELADALYKANIDHGITQDLLDSRKALKEQIADFPDDEKTTPEYKQLVRELAAVNKQIFRGLKKVFRTEDKMLEVLKKAGVGKKALTAIEEMGQIEEAELDEGPGPVAKHVPIPVHEGAPTSALRSKYSALYAEVMDYLKNAADKFSEDNKDSLAELPKNLSPTATDTVELYNELVEIANEVKLPNAVGSAATGDSKATATTPKNNAFDNALNDSPELEEKFHSSVKPEDKGLIHQEQNLFSKLRDTASSVYKHITKNFLDPDIEALNYLVKLFTDKDNGWLSHIDSMMQSQTGVEVREDGTEIVHSKNDFSQYFLDENGQMSENVAGAILMSLINLLQTRANGMMFNTLDTINKIANHNLPESEKQEAGGITYQTYPLVDAGDVLSSFTDNIGGYALRLMGIRPNDTANPTDIDVLRTNLGQMVVSAGLSLGIFELNYAFRTEKDYERKPRAGENRVGKDGKPLTKIFEKKGTWRVSKSPNKNANEGVPMTLIRPVAKGTSDKDKYKLHESITEVLDKLNATVNLMPLLIGEGMTDNLIRFDGQDMPTAAKRGDGVDTSPEQKEGLDNYNNTPFVGNTVLANVLTAINDEDEDYIATKMGGLKGGGVTPRGEEHKDNTMSNEASRVAIAQQLETIKKTFEAMAKVGATTLRFVSRAGSNLRMTMVSNLANPQASQLHRYAFPLQSATITIDPKDPEQAKLVTIYKMAIMQGLGYDVDKNPDKWSEALFQEVIQKEEVQAAIKALKKGENVGKPMIAALNSVKKSSPAAIAALISLADYSPDSKFTTTITKSSDGITNGVAFGLLQYMGASSFEDLVSRLVKVGITLNDFDQSYGEYHEQAAAGERDPYVELTSLMNEYLSNQYYDPKTNSLKKMTRLPKVRLEGGSSFLPQSWKAALKKKAKTKGSGVRKFGASYFLSPKKEQQESIKQSLKVLLKRTLSSEDIAEMLEDGTNDADRNMAKDPVMQFVYGAGMKGLKKALAYKMINSLRSSLEEIAREKDEKKRADMIVNLEQAVENLLWMAPEGTKKLFTVNKENPLQTDISNQVMQAIAMSSDLTYGNALESAFERQYGEFRQVTQTMLTMTRIAAAAYIQTYETRVNALAEAKGRENITVKDIRDIEKDLEEIYPMYGTYFSSQHSDADIQAKLSGISGMKRERTSDYNGNVFADKEETVVRKRFKINGKDKQLSTSTHSTKPVNPGVSLGAIFVHSMDATVMIDSMLASGKLPFLNVHDAKISAPTVEEDSVVRANKAFLDINANYSAFGAVLEVYRSIISNPAVDIVQLMNDYVRPEEGYLLGGIVEQPAEPFFEAMNAYFDQMHSVLENNRAMIFGNDVNSQNYYSSDSVVGTWKGNGEAEGREWMTLPDIPEGTPYYAEVLAEVLAGTAMGSPDSILTPEQSEEESTKPQDKGSKPTLKKLTAGQAKDIIAILKAQLNYLGADKTFSEEQKKELKKLAGKYRGRFTSKNYPTLFKLARTNKSYALNKINKEVTGYSKAGKETTKKPFLSKEEYAAQQHAKLVAKGVAAQKRLTGILKGIDPTKLKAFSHLMQPLIEQLGIKDTQTLLIQVYKDSLTPELIKELYTKDTSGKLLNFFKKHLNGDVKTVYSDLVETVTMPDGMAPERKAHVVIFLRNFEKAKTARKDAETTAANAPAPKDSAGPNPISTSLNKPYTVVKGGRKKPYSGTEGSASSKAMAAIKAAVDTALKGAEKGKENDKVIAAIKALFKKVLTKPKGKDGKEKPFTDTNIASIKGYLAAINTTLKDLAFTPDADKDARDLLSAMAEDTLKALEGSLDDAEIAKQRGFYEDALTPKKPVEKPIAEAADLTKDAFRSFLKTFAEALNSTKSLQDWFNALVKDAGKDLSSESSISAFLNNRILAGFEKVADEYVTAKKAKKTEDVDRLTEELKNYLNVMTQMLNKTGLTNPLYHAILTTMGYMAYSADNILGKKAQETIGLENFSKAIETGFDAWENYTPPLSKVYERTQAKTYAAFDELIENFLAQSPAAKYIFENIKKIAKNNENEVIEESFPYEAALKEYIRGANLYGTHQTVSNEYYSLLTFLDGVNKLAIANKNNTTMIAGLGSIFNQLIDDGINEENALLRVTSLGNNFKEVPTMPEKTQVDPEADDTSEIAYSRTGVSDSATSIAVRMENVDSTNMTEVFESLASLDLADMRPQGAYKDHLTEVVSQLSTVVDAFKLKVFSAAEGEESGGLINKSLKEVMLTVQSLAKQNQIEMSAQELFVHEVLHSLFGLKSVKQSKEWQVIKQLYNRALKQLEPKHFLDNPATATDADWAAARARYAHAFENAIGGGTTTTTRLGETKKWSASDPVEEFAVMALTNKQLFKALSTMSKESMKEGPKNWVQQFTAAVRDVLDFVLRTVTSKPNVTADVELMRAFKGIVASENQRKQALYRNASKKPSILDRADKKITDTTKKATAKALAKLAGGSKTASYAQWKKATTEVLGDLAENMGITKSDTATAIYHQFTTGRKSFAHMRKLITKSTYMIEQKSLRIKTHVKEVLDGLFSDNVTKSARYAITRGLLRTDFKTIYDSMGEEAFEMLNDKKRRARIQELKRAIRNTAPKQARYLIENAADLGYHLVTGGRLFYGSAGATNAQQISHLWGIDKKPKSYDPASTTQLVDELASLEALNHIEPSDKTELLRLFETKKPSLKKILAMHGSVEDNARNSDFEHNSMLMRKGYVSSPNKSDIDIVMSDGSNHKQLVEQGYERTSFGGPQDKLVEGGVGKQVYYYVNKYGGLQRHVTGIISLDSGKSSGVSIFSLNTAGSTTVSNADVTSTILDTHRLNRQKQILREDMYKTGGKRIPMNELRKGVQVATPIYTADGQITGYRYQLNTQVKDTMLETDLDFAEALSFTVSKTVRLTNSRRVNEEAIEAMAETWRNEYEKKPNSFILIGPHAKEKKYKDAYYLLPERDKQVLHTAFGNSDKFYIKRSQFNAFFGFKKLGINNLVKRDTEEGRHIYNLLVGVNNLLVPVLNNRIGREGTKYFLEAVRAAKDTMVIKSGVITAGNILSNVVLLTARGVPLTDAVTGTYKAYKDTFEYLDADRKATQLELKLLLEEQEPTLEEKDLIKMRAQVNYYKKVMHDSPVRDLMEAGMYQSIVDDVDMLHSIDYETNMPAVDKAIKALPTGLVSVGKQILMTHDTAIYSTMRDFAQIADFAARKVNHDYNMKNGMAFEDSIEDIDTTFINYDIPSTPFIQFLSDVGISPFITYFMRVQQVLVKAFGEKPTQMMLATFLASTLGFSNIMESMIGIDALLYKLQNPMALISSGAEALPFNLLVREFV